MYSRLFADLHVSLPFDAFTAGVVRELNVAPTRLHPNSRASMRAFHIVRRTFGLRPLPVCFLHFYSSYPARVEESAGRASRRNGVVRVVTSPTRSERRGRCRLARCFGFSLAGGDRTFSRAVGFGLPSGLEEEIKSVPEDDLLDGGIEMIRRGPSAWPGGVPRLGGATRRRFPALSMTCKRRVIIRSEAMEANTAYEKQLCAQTAEPELCRSRLAEPEKAEEVVLLRKALEKADHRASLAEKEGCCRAAREGGGRSRGFENHGGYHGFD
ncbi:hypothetical protein ACSQ67_021136 [Phaseolus vulgaris]